MVFGAMSAKSKRRVAVIWLPNWPVQRLRDDRPELDGRPIIVSTTLGGRGKRVLCCCGEAAALGIGRDMTLAETAALLPRKTNMHGQSVCRDRLPAHIESHDPFADREALARLAGWCQRFSPVVGIEDTELPDSLLLNITGLAHLFGGEAGLAEEIVRSFWQRRFEVRVSVARTVAAAWALAHYGFEHAGGFEHAEGFEHADSGRAASSCYLVLTPGDEHLLGTLPLAALRLSPAVIQPLGRLGIDRIEQLDELPRSELFQRLGDEVNRRLDQLTGAIDEPIVVHQVRPELCRSWSFEPATTHTDTIHHVLGRLVEQLLRLLAEQNQGAVQLTCRFVCEGGQRVDIHPHFFQPTTEAGQVQELALLQLDGQRFPSAVSRLVVTVTASAPLVWRQGEFFAVGAERHPQQLARLINQLSNRLGRDRVVRPVLRGEAQPERAFRDVPLITHGGRGRVRAAVTVASRPFERPLHLLTPPVAVEVIAALPDGPPTRLHYQQQVYDVGCYWGPERIQTGWWRGRTIQRDYYRIEAETGNRFWVFRRLGDGRWFLHGEFA
jgi:protein ImuB